jgi:TolB-like protein/Flp pilus assembly protein TadD
VADVFVSYSSDDRVVARMLADALEQEGFSVWWDQDLRSGDTYDERIETALHEAKAVVVLWSPRSVASRWVRSEATLADRRGKLAPATIVPCERPVAFELTQAADLTRWRGGRSDPEWRRFVEVIGTLTEREAPLAPAPTLNPDLPDKPSIAVLPFLNVGGNEDQAYFVDGLMEEIAAALTRIRTLFVISSGSTLALRGENLSPVEAASRLGVQYVLEGSIRAAGHRLRISVRLLDGATGSQIWTDRFDDTMEDVFALQDKVALAVAGITEFSVQKAEAVLAAKRSTSDLRAYDLYLRALVPFRTYQRENISRALALLEDATYLDPQYALAHSLAAGCHALVLQFSWTDDPAHHAARLSQVVEKAVYHGSDDAQVLASSALALWVVGRFDEAMRLADRAADLNPGSSFPLLVSGQLHATAGDLDIAEDHIERSMRLDPFSPNRALQLAALAQMRYARGHFAEAAQLAREWSQINKSPLSAGLLAACYGMLGTHDAAREAYDELRRLTSISVADVGAMIFRDPAQHSLFLEGIAVIEATA